MTYTPNFTNPGVESKIRRALGWAAACLSPDPNKSRSWSRTELDCQLGHSHRQYGRWIRNQLLICADSNYEINSKKCKKYLLNLEGFNRLCDQYQISRTSSQHRTQIAQSYLKSRFQKELETGNFKYKEKSHRKWHPLQNVPNEQRQPLFVSESYIYEYDIVCCAPTIIVQMAQRQGLSKRTRIDHIREYLIDRTRHRQRLAQHTGLDPDVIKRVINASFAGARLGPDNSIYQIINDPQAYDLIRRDPWFLSMKKEIRKCWNKIRLSDERRLSPRDKWMKYFEVENLIMSSVQAKMMKEIKQRIFLEHDGWRCDSFVDPELLTREVLMTTGYRVQFEYKRYEQ